MAQAIFDVGPAISMQLEQKYLVAEPLVQTNQTALKENELQEVEKAITSASETQSSHTISKEPNYTSCPQHSSSFSTDSAHIACNKENHKHYDFEGIDLDQPSAMPCDMIKDSSHSLKHNRKNSQSRFDETLSTRSQRSRHSSNSPAGPDSFKKEFSVFDDLVKSATESDPAAAVKSGVDMPLCSETMAIPTPPNIAAEMNLATQSYSSQINQPQSPPASLTSAINSPDPSCQQSSTHDRITTIHHQMDQLSDLINATALYAISYDSAITSAFPNQESRDNIESNEPIQHQSNLDNIIEIDLETQPFNCIYANDHLTWDSSTPKTPDSETFGTSRSMFGELGLPLFSQLDVEQEINDRFEQMQRDHQTAREEFMRQFDTISDSYRIWNDGSTRQTNHFETSNGIVASTETINEPTSHSLNQFLSDSETEPNLAADSNLLDELNGTEAQLLHTYAQNASEEILFPLDSHSFSRDAPILEPGYIPRHRRIRQSYDFNNDPFFFSESHTLHTLEDDYIDGNELGTVNDESNPGIILWTDNEAGLDLTFQAMPESEESYDEAEFFDGEDFAPIQYHFNTMSEPNPFAAYFDRALNQTDTYFGHGLRDVTVDHNFWDFGDESNRLTRQDHADEHSEVNWYTPSTAHYEDDGNYNEDQHLDTVAEMLEHSYHSSNSLSLEEPYVTFVSHMPIRHALNVINQSRLFDFTYEAPDQNTHDHTYQSSSITYPLNTVRHRRVQGYPTFRANAETYQSNRDTVYERLANAIYNTDCPSESDEEVMSSFFVDANGVVCQNFAECLRDAVGWDDGRGVIDLNVSISLLDSNGNTKPLNDSFNHLDWNDDNEDSHDNANVTTDYVLSTGVNTLNDVYRNTIDSIDNDQIVELNAHQDTNYCDDNGSDQSDDIEQQSNLDHANSSFIRTLFPEHSRSRGADCNGSNSNCSHNTKTHCKAITHTCNGDCLGR
ncbi:hypothetical protein RTP6_002585 [Batrachochytrium dendrobatidis]